MIVHCSKVNWYAGDPQTIGINFQCDGTELMTKEEWQCKCNLGALTEPTERTYK